METALVAKTYAILDEVNESDLIPEGVCGVRVNYDHEMVVRVSFIEDIYHYSLRKTGFIKTIIKEYRKHHGKNLKEIRRERTRE